MARAYPDDARLRARSGRALQCARFADAIEARADQRPDTRLDVLAAIQST